MKYRRWNILLLTASVLITGLVACGTVDTPNEESAENTDAGENEGEFFSEEYILTYFLEADEAHITLDISKARAEYMMEIEGADGVDDMQYTLQVERTGELDIVNTDEESVAVEEIHEGDKVYAAYDIEDYMDKAESVIQIDTDRLVIDNVTPEEMIQRFAPSDGDGYYVGIVHRRGEGWGGYDEFDLEHLLDYDHVTSFGSILHQDGVPAYDYVEAFDIEKDLPIFFIISQDGLEYQTYELDEVDEFLEEG